MVSQDLKAEENPETAARRHWMSVLAKAPPKRLATLYGDCEGVPRWDYLRAPETGMVMTQGRAGGSGQAFNLGELAVTRCSVRLAGSDGSERVGHAYVAGRDRDHATQAALVDALMQDPARRAAVQAAVIRPLAEEAEARRLQASRKAAATKVEFFTMVRGENA